MRPFLTTVFVFLLAFQAKSQLFMIPYLTGGPTYFGALGVTVTSSGGVSSGGASICLSSPTGTTQYWIGMGSVVGQYTYTFTRPIYRFSVHTWGMNGGPVGGGESVDMFVNGAPYAITPADVTSYTECAAGGGPCYLSAGALMGPAGPTTGYNGGDFTITSISGITSFECHTTGTSAGGMSAYGTAYIVFIDTLFPFHAENNSPCIGDTLRLTFVGDSTGSTYSWTGPGGFTSTLQSTYIFPSTLADTGWYKCVRITGPQHDSDSTHVVIHPKPIINATSNSPLCRAGTSTLQLFSSPAAPGETFLWSGPFGYTSTLQNPTFSTFVAADTGNYFVYATTVFGCKDTDYTHVTTIPQPPTPVVTDQNYCQNDPFVPFAVSGLITGDTVKWYYFATGGYGSTTPIVVNTAIPGVYHVWVTQKNGACESLRGTDSVRVTTTPPAPVVTGRLEYCQYIGTITPLTATTTVSGVLRWYTSATGGSFTTSMPFPSISVAGTTDYYVSQVDSGCESPRTHAAIIVHPKPNPPIIIPTPICQYQIPVPMRANLSGPSTDVMTWYGPGFTPGSSVPPIPPTNIAPDTIKIYVTETSIYGCISDSALDAQVVKVKPPVPVTRNTRYCQHDKAKPLNALVDSFANSHLNWYYRATTLNPTPIPFTDTIPGTFTWYASQTVPNDATGCESDSAAVNVNIIYKPVFGIKVTPNWVCQSDTLRLSYCCGTQVLNAPSYLWVLPQGATPVPGSHVFDSSIVVEFDSARRYNSVKLIATNDSGFCMSDTTINIKVVGHPDMGSFTQPDVCLNDTVLVGLSMISNGAHDFKWYIDNVPFDKSGAIKMISSSSNSGGPFTISWVTAGVHTIKLTSTTIEGCKSAASYDSVSVHNLPDASFQATGIHAQGQFCLEDSVFFEATNKDYNYNYEWSPAHAFNNLNTPKIWGKVEFEKSIITLKVTDPFGCFSTTSQTFQPETCCSVLFPNAFTPNGSGKNNVFRPIFTGYHKFHTFKIVNRWGITVFEGGNTNVSWDGTLNGAPQDMGTYMYYLKYDCGGKTLEAKGDLTLIR